MSPNAAKDRFDSHQVKFGDNVASLDLNELRARAARMIGIVPGDKLAASLLGTDQTMLLLTPDELTWSLEVAYLAWRLLLRVWISYTSCTALLELLKATKCTRLH